MRKGEVMMLSKEMRANCPAPDDTDCNCGWVEYANEVANLETCDLCDEKAEYRQCQQCMNDMLVGSHTDEQHAKLLQAVNDKDTELFESQELAAALLEMLESLARWVGKGIADGAYSDCANPECAMVDLERATEAIRKAT